MESEETTKVHLVLSAGGARVISYVGALNLLAERNISFASLSACSAGAFMGALLCAGKTPAEIEKWAFEIDLSVHMGERVFPRPLRFLSFWKWPFATYKQPGFPELFCELLQDNPRFQDLTIPFATAGVDMVSNRILVYSSETHPNMPVSEAIRIALALPFMYPPHEKQGRLVVDAAIVSQSPVWIAAAYPDEFPILVLKPARPTDLYNPKNVFAYVEDIFSSAVGSRDDYLIKQIPRVRVIEIDCGTVAEHRFKLSTKEKAFLMAQGRTAAEDLLSLLGNDLSNIPLVPARRITRDPAATEDDVAERYGENLMNRFHQRLSNLVREHVFISYSHEDRDWLEKFQTHLKPYTRNASVTVWDDTQIKGGARWRHEIEFALRAAKVAVLLVSPDFLASDFIAEQELPPLLEAAESEGLTILWIPLSHSAYRETKIGDYQAAPGCDPDQPLSSLSEPEQDRIFVAVCEEIKRLVGAG